MKHLLTFLTLSLLLSQELEVEGDLKVTGTMESTTIDSMQQVIDGLQVQIDSMHADNQLETRVYTLSVENLSNDIYEFDIISLTGYNLDYAILDIYKISNYQTPSSNGHWIYSYCTEIWENGVEEWKTGTGLYVTQYGFNMMWGTPKAIYYYGDNKLAVSSYEPFSGDIIFSVTAQFPD